MPSHRPAPSSADDLPRPNETACPATSSANDARGDRDTAFGIAMRTSHLVWWDWNVPGGEIHLHTIGPCFLGDHVGSCPSTHRGWLDRVHPDERDAVAAEIEACLSGVTDSWSREHRFGARDGGWIWVRNNGLVTRRDPATRRAIRLVGTTQDIQRSRAAESILARDAAILAHIQDAVWCLDRDLVHTYWSPGAEALYGWTSAEIVGRPLSYRVAPTRYAAADADLRRVLAGETIAREQDIVRRDGSTAWVDMHIYPFYGSGEQVEGVMAVARDISQRRQEFEQRQRMERQLAQTQKMETLGTLAGGIAHDFNNLLAAILGYTEIATNLLPPGHIAAEKLDNVTVAGRRAAELVRRILAFSRVSEQTRAPVCLGTLVEETLPLIRASIPSTIAIEFDPPAAEVVCHGDATQLQQVLINSCANSAHALRGREDGVIRIQVAAVDLDSTPPTQVGVLHPGAHVFFSVTDNGPGISAAVLERIFEPFFTTKPRGEGTGLGLAMAGGIVTAHGGAIRVDSLPGRGASFRFYLPRLDQRAAEQPETPASTGRARGRGEAIAIIDDEESIALLAQQALSHHGYRTYVFDRAHDCLEQLLARPDAFRLVITDQTMPRMTGLDLVRALRAVGNPVPVLMISGYAKDLEPGEISGIPHFAFVGKPFDLHALLGTVRRLLDDARA